MNRSIAFRLLVCVLAPLAALIIVAGAAADAAIRARMLASLDREILAQAEAIAALTEWDAGRVRVELDEPDVSAGSHAPLRGIRYEGWLADGKALFRSDSAKGLSLRPPESAKTWPAHWDVKIEGGKRGRAAAIKFLPRSESDAAWARGGGGEAPEVTLAAAADAEPAQRAITELRLALAALFAALLGACAAAALGGLRWGLRPLEALGGAVEGIDAGSLGKRLPDGELPRELRPLAAKLNELLARLEGSFARERRFSADAAHELRTPVTELRALAEVALAGAEELDDKTRPAFQDALEIAQRMQGVIEGLLTLAKCDGEGRGGGEAEIDLAAEIAEAWRQAEPRAAARGVRAGAAPTATIRARGNPQAARLILRNLLSNAAEHADPAEPIEIRSTGGERGFEVIVSNAAPELAAEDAERMFERFWRKDGSRSSAAHCGLGLPIARALAESQGWRLSARMTSGGRLEILLDGGAGGSGA